MNPENTFEFYRDYHNQEEAEAFATLLKENNIPYSLEEAGHLDVSEIVGHGLIPKAVLKIQPENFRRVNDLLSAEIKESGESDFTDHYLSQLDIDELKDIFRKPEEWTVEDATIAQIILKSRGVDISEQEIKELREERLAVIREGKKASLGMLTFYGACIFLGLFFHLIFYLGGMGMAFYYTFGKSTDIDGQKNYVYDEETRQTGKVMFYGGFLAPVLCAWYIKAMFG